MSFWNKLKNTFKGSVSTEKGLSQAEFEEKLILADFGPQMAEKLSKHAGHPDKLRSMLLETLQPVEKKLELSTDHTPCVLLMVGVNGAGKTTTLAKLAHRFKDKKIGFVAADTFRHGAVEQLRVWADRLNVTFYSGKDDPAAVAFDALDTAKHEHFDALMIDTSGRLHNQANLMEELAKIKRVLQKVEPTAPHETILIVDATTGQNAYIQVEEFHRSMKLSGLIMTKMDGTAKGGTLVRIADELKIPVYGLTSGEQLDDMTDFDAEKFVNSILP